MNKNNGVTVTLPDNGMCALVKKIDGRYEIDTGRIERKDIFLSPWVKTSDRLPTESDGYVIGLQKSRFDCGDGLVPFVTWYAGLNVTKSECVYWMPLPKLPEVE